MTATTSVNKSFFGRRFLTDLAENKKLLIINIVLEILGLPVITTVGLIMMKLRELEENYDELLYILIPFMMLGVGTLIISILLGIVIALFHFNYLYRKSIVDMNYSLPLSTTQRFFADYLSGLCIYIIPAVCAVILSLIILGGGGMFVDTTVILDELTIILQIVAITLVGMIMFYTVSILSIVFCGSTFEAIYSIIAVNVMIPSVIACLWFAVISASSYGMVFGNILTNPLFSATSPIGALIFIFSFMFESVPDAAESGQMQYYNSMFLRWILVAIVVTIVYLAAAFLLNRFRKAESVSKPYVYKAYFYVIFGASVFCIMSLFISNGISSIPAVIMCAVGWFIMEVITRRGFKKFWTAPIGFVATVIGVYMICGFCNLTNGFGASRRVPPTISVESLTFSAGSDSILPYGVDEINFRDKDVIKAVTALNKEAVDRHFKFDDYSYEFLSESERSQGYDNSNFAEITYHTYYGTTVMREYNVPTYMLADVVSAILTSDEYAEFAADKMALSVANQSNSQYFRTLEEAYKKNKKFNLTVRNKLQMTALTTSYSAKELEEIRKAYEADLKNMTADNLKNDNVYCYIEDYWVLDSFENTKKALGVDIAPIDISVFENRDSYSDYALSVDKYPNIFFDVKDSFKQNEDNRQPFSMFTGYYDYDYSANDRYAKLDTIVNVFNNNRYYGAYGYNSYGYDETSTLHVNRYLEELIEVAKPIVIDEKPIAVIKRNGYQLYIIDTPENRTLIKKYFKN